MINLSIRFLIVFAALPLIITIWSLGRICEYLDDNALYWGVSLRRKLNKFHLFLDKNFPVRFKP